MTEVAARERLTRRAENPRADEYVRLFDETPRAPEPTWLGALRRAGISDFEQLGFPTSKNEDWHFTSVAPITARLYTPRSGAFDETSHAEVRRPRADDIAPFLFDGEWDVLAFVDGRFDADLSFEHRDLSGPACEISPLSATVEGERPRELERHLGGLALMQSHAFTALNTAFAGDGAAILLRADGVAPRPIHILFVTTDAAEGTLISPRNVIVLGAHAEATVVESYVSLGGSSYFTNAVTEVYVGEGARLKHYKIQRESINGYHVGSSYAHQDRASHYEAFSFATGADLSRTNVMTLLDGEGAHVTLNGLYMVNGDQVVDHQTMIEHIKESCTSHELYKGVLDGGSHAVFNGKVYVRPEAQKTDGKQSNNNLLLSDHARIDTKPQLEIYADDVKCTHGATVGRLDATAMFYLKSRGIGEDVARKLLTYAFAADVLEELTVPSVREELEALAFSRFAVEEKALQLNM